MQENTIVVSAKQSTKKQLSKYDFPSDGGSFIGSTSSGSANPVMDQTRLQFFLDNKQVAGFGWMNDNQFCFGTYDNNDSGVGSNLAPKDYILKQKHLKQIQYLRKETDQPVEGELPTGFVITLSHILFMYPNNITVVSKISHEIVYSFNQNM